MHAREILNRWSEQVGWDRNAQLDILCGFINGRSLSRELDQDLAGRVLGARLGPVENELQDHLDELVHEAASQEASAINNGGLDDQLTYLISCWGPEETAAAVERMLKPGGAKSGREEN